MNNREAKRCYVMGLFTGVMCCVTVFLILQLIGAIPSFWQSSFVKNVSKKAAVIEKYVDSKYILGNVSKKDMADQAAKGMISALGDRYSAYITEEEMEETQAGTDGVFCGVGMTLQYDSDTKEKIVTDMEKDAPAEKAGIKKNDVIIKVDGKDVRELSLNDTVALVKKNKGEQVTITVERTENKEKTEKEFTMTCETITTVSVQYKMLEDQQGYIAVSGFNHATESQFETAIDELEKQGAKGLILDLRNNGGGNLDTCVTMLDRILPAGKMFSEKGKDQTREFSSTDKQSYDKPIAILINGSSASASELFAGTLQDLKKATLVGTQSFGKGIVQSVFTLNKAVGGGVKLTTARYYLPSGRCIHEIGLTPDVKVELTGSIGKSDDNQLEAAKQELKKKILES